jgi:hypothetical protein
MSAAKTVRKTVNHPPVLRQHRVAVPGKRGTDGYRNEFAAIAKGFALLGATHSAIASLFGVHEDTIRNWKRDHPRFRKALEEGGERADGFVAHAYFKRAVGYTTIATTTEKRTTYDTDGNVTGTVTITTTETRELPPDPLAAWRWLQRRQRWGLDEPEVTVEDIGRVAQAARKEAERRGISLRSAIPLVQQEHRVRLIPRCPTCGGLWIECEAEHAGEARRTGAAVQDRYSPRHPSGAAGDRSAHFEVRVEPALHAPSLPARAAGRWPTLRPRRPAVRCGDAGADRAAPGRPRRGGQTQGGHSRGCTRRLNS